MAFDFLTQQCGVAPERIVLYGRSIGTGTACHLAATLQQMRGATVGALMLQSPFLSIKALARSLVGRWANLMWNRFNNEAELAHCRCPLFILHGRHDQVRAPSATA